MRTLPSPLTRAPIALLSLGVVLIHVIDQGGVIGDKAPRYVGVGYWLLELAGLGACALVMANRRIAYRTTAAVAGLPIVGYVLSRSIGLPAYTDDRGNWGERLGLVSIAVELALLAISLLVILPPRRRRLADGARRSIAPYGQPRRTTTSQAGTV
jgi:hypothetical protein